MHKNEKNQLQTEVERINREIGLIKKQSDKIQNDANALLGIKRLSD